MFGWFKKKELTSQLLDRYAGMVDTEWSVAGINDGKPILKVLSVENGHVNAVFTSEGNEGKKHYQEINQFYSCFTRHEG